MALSPVYETEPVGVAARFAHACFLNCVAIAETTLSAAALAHEAHAIEERCGRTRSGNCNEPRTLDIDIVAMGDFVCESPELTLPHPRARQRRFVLQPLVDLRPDYRLPGDDLTVSSLLCKLPLTPRVTPFSDAANLES